MIAHIGKWDTERIDEATEQGYEVLFAYHGYGSYEGEWFALFRKDGDLFTDQGSHCSCYDWDSFNPQKTTIATELSRLSDIYSSWNSPFSYATESFSYPDGNDKADVARRDYVDLILRLAAQHDITFTIKFEEK